MAEPIRIEALALPVPHLAPAEKFYRWVLAMEGAPFASKRGIVLGWGKEDRIELIDAAEGAEEAVVLRLPVMAFDAAAAWLLERNLVPDTAVVPAAYENDGRAAWPHAVIQTGRDDDRFRLTVRGAVEPRIDLDVPLAGGPATPPIRRIGSTALEVPGLLGVTTGAPDLRAAREHLARFGFEPLDPGTEKGPLRVGDQQWIVEEREPAGIYGIAVVVELDRIKDLVRTLERLGAQHRHAGNRLLALDPAGRVLLVHGLKGG